MSNTELSTAKSYTFLRDFDLAAALSEEMTGMRVTFDRVTIPTTGGTAFEVPGALPGETDTVKEFSGVILFHHPLFSYYRESYTGGKNPPDCGSYDGITGVGDPGGSCADCPLNQFGSGENGGKACKNKRRIFVLREGETIPLVLTLPTGSMKEFGVYIKRLLGKGRKSCSVVTRFSLKKATNVGGIAYSQAQFKHDRPLTEAELTAVSQLVEQVKEYAKHTATSPVDLDEFTDVPTPFDPVTGEIVEP